ncbi:MAG: DUF5591 domain-containing protein [Candidatus Thorarchaeota archaeon]|nr:DUF5591 domain-containing protein [Candidatus Thorarchaeota archaeon]
MTQFLIGRGHDGPARQGTLRSGSGNFTTPLLMGSSNAHILPVRYFALGREEPPEGCMTVGALPSVLFEGLPDLSSLPDLVLLPSITASSMLGPEAAADLLRSQIRLVRSFSVPTLSRRAVLRVPPEIRAADARELFSDASSAGLSAAAIAFDGRLGPADLRSLRLRTLLPRNWLALAIGYIEPAMIPLLYYFGFDIFDAGMGEYSAAASVRLWESSAEHICGCKDVPSRYCVCPACSDIDLTQVAYDQLSVLLAKHNQHVYIGVLSRSIHAMGLGQLRPLVESMTHHSPGMAALLRHVDHNAYPFLEEFTPTIGSGVVPLIGPESYNSPAVRRFRERVADVYIPPHGKRVVLLLPCSAKKPYSDSKSHRLFRAVIESALVDSRQSLAEAILTSPLGLVPRELERVFPAANYDIPVTGDWDAEETRLATEALVSYLAKFDEEAVVVAHVREGYASIVRDAESRVRQSIVYTTEGHPPASPDSLRHLRETLEDLKSVLSLKGGRPADLEQTLRATADFQFGQGAGLAVIPPGSQLNGKLYRTVVCRYNKEQTCSFISETGTLSLTIVGGAMLAPLGRRTVQFDGESLSGGSLFAVGVKDADPEIRPGDEVIVVNRDGEVVGVGKSEMSGREMCEFDNGRAVSLRHKKV